MFSISYAYCSPSLSYIRLITCIALYFVNAAGVLVSASFQGQLFKNCVCGSECYSYIRSLKYIRDLSYGKTKLPEDGLDRLKHVGVVGIILTK